MTVPLVVLLLLLSAAPAGAQTTATSPVQDATTALASDPVYVGPGADPGLTPSEQERVRAAIARSDAGPVYVAVLDPDAALQAGGDPGELVRQIGESLRRPGTYVVASGRRLRAASTLLERGRAGALVQEAIAARRSEGLASILVDFVSRVAHARASRGQGGSDRDRGGGGFPVGLLLFLGIPAAAFAISRRRRRRQQAAELEEVRSAARDDVFALGEEVRGLDLDVEMPNADPGAREHYGAALGAYERASGLIDHARRPEDLAEVGALSEEGRYEIAATKALLAGRQLPERRPPCFFDPRHGPSVRDVEWSPYGGVPRPVPACAADAIAVEEGADPNVRHVMAGGRMTPYWGAGPAFGPWAGGFFGGFGMGGLLPGFLIGSMFGGSMFGGIPDVAYGDQGGGGDFGDFGGGDFGGFGGGDFGGGDFGGGGGDF